MHDIVIVGAGPAGLTAAIYALRFNKSVLVIEKSTFGGQITYSPKVENYPGFKEMSGNEFADLLVEQVLSLGGEIELDTVTEIKPGKITCESGNVYEAKAIIIAAGSKHRQLGLDNENELVGNGVSYCAVCDGAFCKGQDVAVIGGGNTALQEAVLLSDICKSVTVVQNLDSLTGEKKLADKLYSKDNVKIICSSTVCELVGSDKLTAVRIKSTDGEISTLDVDAVFVAIGQVPENKPFENVCSLDDYGYIKADEKCLTGTNGIFVAGDCRTKAVRQITTATGDGAVAAVNACKYIDSL